MKQASPSIGTLGRDDSVIPRVTFLSYMSLSNRQHVFAKPRFRVWIPCCWESSQASFCLYTLLRISDPDELTFGRR